MRIHHIFLGVDGEVNKWGQGVPSVFIRLQGCNIDPFCSYCDIPEAQNLNGGREMTINEVIKHIRAFECPKVTITGGEPLLQEEEIHELLNRLFQYQYKVSIETNGTISTARFRDCRKPNPNVCLVVDFKFRKHVLEAFQYLHEWDWVKIIIKDQNDFKDAQEALKMLRAWDCKARFALSPIHETLPGKTLAQWILDAKMWDVVLNCQIHKFLSIQ